MTAIDETELDEWENACHEAIIASRIEGGPYTASIKPEVFLPILAAARSLPAERRAREEAERERDGLQRWQDDVRSASLLVQRCEATEARATTAEAALAAALAERNALQRYADDTQRILADPAAVRINLLQGTIAKPDDVVFLHDTNGPVAELRTVLAAERERVKALEERLTVICSEFAQQHPLIVAARRLSSEGDGVEAVASSRAKLLAALHFYSDPKSYVRSPEEGKAKTDRDAGGLARAALAILPGGAEMREGWQPIETAPRDHLAKLVWSPDLGMVVAFLDVTWAWWTVPNGDGPLETPPTYWRPLPAWPRDGLAALPLPHEPAKQEDVK